MAVETNEPGTAEKLNNNETTFAESATAKLIIEQVKDMVDSGYWGENYMANTYADAAKAFADGQAAMFLANQGFGAEVTAVAPDFDTESIGYFVAPLADNQVLNVNPVGPTRFVYAASENAEYAKQYLEFLGKAENQQYMIDNVAKFNILPFDGLTDKYPQSVRDLFADYPDQGTVYQTAVKYVNPQWTEIGKELHSGYVPVWREIQLERDERRVGRRLRRFPAVSGVEERAARRHLCGPPQVVHAHHHLSNGFHRCDSG